MVFDPSQDLARSLAVAQQQQAAGTFLTKTPAPAPAPTPAPTQASSNGYTGSFVGATSGGYVAPQITPRALPTPNPIPTQPTAQPATQPATQRAPQQTVQPTVQATAPRPTPRPTTTQLAQDFIATNGRPPSNDELLQLIAQRSATQPTTQPVAPVQPTVQQTLDSQQATQFKVPTLEGNVIPTSALTGQENDLQSLLAQNQAALQAYQAQIQSLLTPSQQELDLQNQLLSSQDAQRNLQIQNQEAQLQEAQRTVPLRFITGRQANIEAQAQLQQQTIASQQQALAERLGVATQQRQTQLDVVQAGLSFVQQNFSNSLQINQAIRQQQQDFLAQADRLQNNARQTLGFLMESAQGLTLDEMDAQSRSAIIQAASQAGIPEGFIANALNVAKDEMEAQLINTQQKSQTQALMDSLSIESLQLKNEQLRQELLGSGQVSYIGEGGQSIISRYTNQAGQPAELNSTQASTIADFTSTEDLAQKALLMMQQGGFSTGPLESMLFSGSKLIGTASPEKVAFEATLENLKASFMKALSGAAVSDSEVARLSKFLPSLSDQEGVLTQKLRSLIEETQNKKSNFLDTLNLRENTTSGLDAALQQTLAFNRASGPQNAEIGTLSERYESGGNPGAIGYDSTGGYSYGTYQLAHNNALRFVQQSPYAQDFVGITFNSPEFRAKWKEIAQNDPEGFKEAQRQYIGKTHYEPQVQKLESVGFDVSKYPKIVADVIWSTAVQHGAGTNVIINALKRVGINANARDLIKEIYNQRWSGGQQFSSSTQKVKDSVYNRFFGANGELNTALKSLA